MIIKTTILLLSLFVLSSCVTTPKNPNDLCSIFKDNKHWKKKAVKAQKRWGTPVPVAMAIINQESSFVRKAKPGRVKFIGIPLWRKSSSYGYSQAKSKTWRWYENSIKKNRDRDNFGHAIDFVGWYNMKTHRTLKVSKWDAYRLYLAYHEGHGGYRAGSFKSKKWLMKVAAKVKRQAARYSAQYKRCQ